jgi:hypothetical protein
MISCLTDPMGSIVHFVKNETHLVDKPVWQEHERLHSSNGMDKRGLDLNSYVILALYLLEVQIAPLLAPAIAQCCTVPKLNMNNLGATKAEGSEPFTDLPMS